MPGLFIKELIASGDLQRCLVVSPGSLAEQWQDELYRRFPLNFKILTNDKLQATCAATDSSKTTSSSPASTSSRATRMGRRLEVPECRSDLVVFDEAHKMSATLFGGEVKFTKRYRLGGLLSGLTRRFLLMTARPRNGKQEAHSGL